MQAGRVGVAGAVAAAAAVRRWVMEPGSTMPELAMAASSAAIFLGFGLVARGGTHDFRVA